MSPKYNKCFYERHMKKRRRPCEDGGRNYNYEVTEQESLGAARSRRSKEVYSLLEERQTW